MQVALSTKISVETAQLLEQAVKETGKPKAHIVEEALKQYLAQK